MRVEKFLEDSTDRDPQKLALIVGEQRISYRDLEDRAARVAAVLSREGVHRGDRVAIFLDNSLEAVVSLFGALKAGAVFSIINHTTKADKLAYILNNCRATALVTHKRLLKEATPALEDSPSVKVLLVSALPETGAPANALSLERELENAAPLPRDLDSVDIDLAMLIYTSGSTGFPKGVMVTHQNVEAAARSVSTYLEHAEDDIIINTLPISFDYGLYQILMSCLVGAAVVLEKGFAYPAAVLKKIREEHVTHLPLVPTMASLLVQMKDLDANTAPDSIRCITNTAAALPPAHIQQLQDTFPAARIYSMYGLTECKRCTWLPPEQLKIRPTSVGKAIPNTEAYVVDEQGQQVAPGVTGELVIRGATVMQGYWENQEATDRALKRGGRYPWEKVLHTGDLFTADEEGYLYFVGRKDDIIKSRGEKVSPKEIENTLYALEQVQEAVVVGVPDEILGMALKAVIVLAEPDTMTERNVLSHCAKHLETYMVPKYVEFRSALPKTSTGKIKRGAVQAEELS